MLKKIGSSVYKHLPNGIKGVINKQAFRFLNKPTIMPQPEVNKKFPDGFKGGVVFSADFELAWAWRYARQVKNPYKLALQCAKLERDNFPFLLDMFETYNIPVTWATVGHLMLQGCKKDDHNHLAQIKPFSNNNWVFKSGNWFEHDPYTNVSENNSWYAPDLVDKLIRSKVPHEIGCHSFSHIPFTNTLCPEEVANSEVSECIKLASQLGISLKSFVFPGGTYGNYNVIKKAGFKVYRRKLEYDLSYPFIDSSGLIVTGSSTGLDDCGYGWSNEYHLKRLEAYVNRAIETQSICHFWFHPSFHPKFMKEIMPKLLKYIANKRQEGKLWVGTMGQLCSKPFVQ